jgi:hypothetical protein
VSTLISEEKDDPHRFFPLGFLAPIVGCSECYRKWQSTNEFRNTGLAHYAPRSFGWILMFSCSTTRMALPQERFQFGSQIESQLKAIDAQFELGFDLWC